MTDPKQSLITWQDVVFGLTGSTVFVVILYFIIT